MGRVSGRVMLYALIFEVGMLAGMCAMYYRLKFLTQRRGWRFPPSGGKND